MKLSSPWQASSCFSSHNLDFEHTVPPGYHAGIIIGADHAKTIIASAFKSLSNRYELEYDRRVDSNSKTLKECTKLRTLTLRSLCRVIGFLVAVGACFGVAIASKIFSPTMAVILIIVAGATLLYPLLDLRDRVNDYKLMIQQSLFAAKASSMVLKLFRELSVEEVFVQALLAEYIRLADSHDVPTTAHRYPSLGRLLSSPPDFVLENMSMYEPIREIGLRLTCGSINGSSVGFRSNGVSKHKIFADFGEIPRCLRVRGDSIDQYLFERGLL